MPSRLLVALLLLLAACNDQYCSRNTDCTASQMCSIEGKCVAATSEATDDAGTTDGSTPDSSTPDTSPDAGTPADAPVDGDQP
jgi:hypothetical protein